MDLDIRLSLEMVFRLCSYVKAKRKLRAIIEFLITATLY